MISLFLMMSTIKHMFWTSFWFKSNQSYVFKFWKRKDCCGWTPSKNT